MARAAVGVDAFGAAVVEGLDQTVQGAVDDDALVGVRGERRTAYLDLLAVVRPEVEAEHLLERVAPITTVSTDVMNSSYPVLPADYPAR